jgi:hypothetical protein
MKQLTLEQFIELLRYTNPYIFKDIYELLLPYLKDVEDERKVLHTTGPGEVYRVTAEKQTFE